MSSIFGPPPPPPPGWPPQQGGAEPQDGTGVAPGEPARPPAPGPLQPQQPQRPRRAGSRRAARWRRPVSIAIASVAVLLLFLANLATWLHVQVFDTERASATVAEATVDDVRTAIRERTVALVDDQVNSVFTDRGLTPPFSVGDDVGRAVDRALASDTFDRAWRAAVAFAVDSQTASSEDRGGAVIEVRLAGEAVAEATRSELISLGYAQLAALGLEIPGYELLTTAPEPRANETLRLADRWWWALGLGAGALGALALLTSADRRRFGIVLGVDAVVAMAVTMLLVPLGRFVVDDLAVDPLQSDLVMSAYGALGATLLVQSGTVLVLAALGAAACAVAPAVQEFARPRVG